MKCTNCGKENRDGAKFCSDCGSRLVNSAPVSAAGTAATVAAAAATVSAAAAVVNTAAKDSAPETPAVSAAPQPNAQPSPDVAPVRESAPAPKTERPEAPKGGFCGNCGASLPVGTNFCPICGMPRGGAQRNTGYPRNNNYTTNNNYINNGGYQPSTVPAHTGGTAANVIGAATRTAVGVAGGAARKKGWIIAICILLALAAIAAALYVFVFKNRVDPRIVGTWRVDSRTIEFLSSGKGSVSNGVGFEYTANDGQIELTAHLLGFSESRSGTYEFSGDKLIIRWNNGEVEYYTKLN